MTIRAFSFTRIVGLWEVFFCGVGLGRDRGEVGADRGEVGVIGGVLGRERGEKRPFYFRSCSCCK